MALLGECSHLTHSFSHLSAICAVANLESMSVGGEISKCSVLLNFFPRMEKKVSWIQNPDSRFDKKNTFNSIVFLESSPASYNSSGFPICSSKNPIDSRVFFESLNSESKRLFFPVQVNELTSSFALFVDTSLSTKITSNCVLIENCRKGRKVAT